jgi:hypothetical protein
VGEQHEGEETDDLAILGQSIEELPSQADGLGGELAADCV